WARVQSGSVVFVGTALPSLQHALLELELRLVHPLLDPRRMDAPILQEFGEGPTGYLAAYRVESGNGDSLGRVIDDEVDAGRLLQRANVATFAADDAALHVVIRQRDNADRGFGNVI